MNTENIDSNLVVSTVTSLASLTKASGELSSAALNSTANILISSLASAKALGVPAQSMLAALDSIDAVVAASQPTKGKQKQSADSALD